jgi:branched-chain amino acid transport system permease protein
MDFGVIFNNTVNALLNAEALYLALAALGLNIHFGYTGLLNFGRSASSPSARTASRSASATSACRSASRSCSGLGLAVLLALLLGIPTLRLRADYLAIVTIASSEVLRLVARSATLRDVTGGSSGLTGFASGFYDMNPLSPGATASARSTTTRTAPGCSSSAGPSSCSAAS